MFHEVKVGVNLSGRAADEHRHDERQQLVSGDRLSGRRDCRGESLRDLLQRHHFRQRRLQISHAMHQCHGFGEISLKFHMDSQVGELQMLEGQRALVSLRVFGGVNGDEAAKERGVECAQHETFDDLLQLVQLRPVGAVEGAKVGIGDQQRLSRDQLTGLLTSEACAHSCSTFFDAWCSNPFTNTYV